MTCTAGREKILELNYQIHQKLLLCQDQILMKKLLAQQTFYVYKSDFYQSLNFESLSFIKI